MARSHEVFPERILDVAYEDLVANQKEVSQRILDYCGLKLEPACLSFYKTSRSVSTASAVQVRRPIYKDAVERWKNYTAHLQPLLDALGDLSK